MSSFFLDLTNSTRSHESTAERTVPSECKDRTSSHAENHALKDSVRMVLGMVGLPPSYALNTSVRLVGPVTTGEMERQTSELS